MVRKVSTLARHDRATSPSVVSRAQRTSRVAVDVRWKALSFVGLIMEGDRGMEGRLEHTRKPEFFVVFRPER